MKMRYKPKPEIKSQEAKKMGKILANALEEEGRLTPATVMIIDNIALLEQTKQQLIEDIKTRGAIELFTQGAQQFYRDNKSVDKLMKVTEQQRKLLAELKLTPLSAKLPVKLPERELDEFEAF